MLAPSFIQIIGQHIPSAKEVCFLDHTSRTENLSSLPDPASLRHYLRSNPTAPSVFGRYLALPFPVLSDRPIVALANAAPSEEVEKHDQTWLQNTLNHLYRLFLSYKQTNIDLLTGLFNGIHLSTLLNTPAADGNIGLILVEIHRPARTAMDAMQDARHAAATLKSFTGEQYFLHHLGHCVFAILCRECQDDSSARLGTHLVAFLKQERFKRVHVGYSQRCTCASQPDQPGKILDEAWHALQIAGRRGPYSFCTYRSLQKSASHSLYSSSRHILSRLRPHWKDLERFALVQLQETPSCADLFYRLPTTLPHVRKIQGPNQDIYLLLSGATQSQASGLVRKILKQVQTETGHASEISAGIATYPFHDFKKSDLVANCRKALLHGALLGPGQVTLFGSLSLNVSGDFYYGEGDMLRAVREYKRGLGISPRDINLLNSLGVSYAMMNRHRLAGDCFTKALSLEQNDFMAWYNLGLGHTSQNNITQAIVSFEQALLCETGDEQDAILARKDLPLHLGKLYYQKADYQKALATLLPITEKKGAAPLPGRILRILGESSYHCGHTQKAIIWLQRAIRFDQFDAEALSLLGELYLSSNQGDQIALKLCEKSIELNPAPALFHLRLARAQIRCHQPDAARESLQHCLTDVTTRPEARFRTGQLLIQQGLTRKAIPWLTKAIALAGDKSPWLQEAQECLRQTLILPDQPQHKDHHAQQRTPKN